MQRLAKPELEARCTTSSADEPVTIVDAGGQTIVDKSRD